MDGTFVGMIGTDGLFSILDIGFNLFFEQFWGRAARASSDSKEFGRPFNFSEGFSRLSSTACTSPSVPPGPAGGLSLPVRLPLRSPLPSDSTSCPRHTA